MTASSNPGGGNLGGRHVLAAMLAFFGVIVVADATMIYKAVTTFGGVDNANAYRDGLAYNTRIEGAARQSELGWRDEVSALKDPARLIVSLRDTAGAPIKDVRVEATLGRPATIRSDTVLQLSEMKPGTFEAPFGEALDDSADAGAGTWIATVRIYRGAKETEPVYQTRRRLWLAP